MALVEYVMTQQPFADRLLSNERIIWSGQAGRGLIFSPQDAFLVPFSLAWCGFAIFWTFTATAAGSPSFFTLWGAMFVCFGLYFVAGRFVFDMWIRRGTRYALTDRRILIARLSPSRSFTAINLSQLPDAELRERADGRGTIRFGQKPSMWGRSGAIWSPSVDPTPQFLAIADARRVFDLIQRTSHSRQV